MSTAAQYKKNKPCHTDKETYKEACIWKYVSFYPSSLWCCPAAPPTQQTVWSQGVALTYTLQSSSHRGRAMMSLPQWRLAWSLPVRKFTSFGLNLVETAREMWQHKYYLHFSITMRNVQVSKWKTIDVACLLFFFFFVLFFSFGDLLCYPRP